MSAIAMRIVGVRLNTIETFLILRSSSSFISAVRCPYNSSSSLCPLALLHNRSSRVHFLFYNKTSR